MICGQKFACALTFAISILIVTGCGEYNDRYDVGYDDGFEHGLDEGYDDGYAEGHEAGYNEGNEAIKPPIINPIPSSDANSYYSGSVCL